MLPPRPTERDLYDWKLPEPENFPPRTHGEADAEALAVFERSRAVVKPGDEPQFHQTSQSIRRSILVSGSAFVFALGGAAFLIHISEPDERIPNLPRDMQQVVFASDVYTMPVDHTPVVAPVEVVRQVREKACRISPSKISRKTSAVPVRNIDAVDEVDDEDKSLTPDQIRKLNDERMLASQVENVLFQARELERKEEARQKAIQEGRPTEEDWE